MYSHAGALLEDRIYVSGVLCLKMCIAMLEDRIYVSGGRIWREEEEVKEVITNNGLSYDVVKRTPFIDCMLQPCDV